MPEKLSLTADIVSAYVMNNSISLADLPSFIDSVHAALSGTAGPPEDEVAAPTPMTSAQIRKSITPDGLVSFLDGRSYKTLKRHLTTQGMTVAAYRTKFGLPSDYPTTSPSYSAARSAMAKQFGLGLKHRPSEP